MVVLINVVATVRLLGQLSHTINQNMACCAKKENRYWTYDLGP